MYSRVRINYQAVSTVRHYLDQIINNLEGLPLWPGDFEVILDLRKNTIGLRLNPNGEKYVTADDMWEISCINKFIPICFKTYLPRTPIHFDSLNRTTAKLMYASKKNGCSSCSMSMAESVISAKIFLVLELIIHHIFSSLWLFSNVRWESLIG